ncbi:MAG TPA: hypothetical protein VFE24_03125 [Pirellulales bacterium]|jgi:hypothetical protein|nr:hypothetical protein [Pirellulales bacterium]
MNSYAILLADKADIWRELGSGFQGDRAHLRITDLLLLLSVVVLVGLAFWALTRIMAKEDRKRGFNSPKALFLALCKAHQLPRRDRRLLKRLARQNGLQPASRMFLEPDLFRSERLAAGLKSQSAQIEALSARLFAVAEAANSAEIAAIPPVE